MPFDLATVKASLSKTHKFAILDESTRSGGVVRP
jgi:pyruvate/2-oxoglutarate/acetoin dehydrogenase E1 component